MSLFGSILDPAGVFSGGSGGGKAVSTAGATSSQSVTTNVSVPITVDNADLANAITALSGREAASAQVQAHAQLTGQALTAAATVQAAQIAASAQPSFYIIGGVIVAVLGLAFTAGLIKLPRGLRA
jgi:hypothetical protein